MKVETLADNIFFNTVKIGTLSAAGLEGSGTGFFYEHHLTDGRRVLFVVTNKHVVKDQEQGLITFLMANKDAQPDLGRSFGMRVDDFERVWFGHPDSDIDIAICPALPLITAVRQESGGDVFLRAVGSELIPSTEELSQLDAIESVTFVGYPNGIWDAKNFLPVARRGTTASPISVDFGGTPRFVIDASVFGGSSGSPVFILSSGMVSDRRGNTVTGGQRLLFVGVVAAVFTRTDLNQIVPMPIPTNVRPMAQHLEMLDLGIVFKARTVVETIDAFVAAYPPAPLA